MIRSQQRARTSIERRRQSLCANTFPGSDAKRFAQISWQIPLDDLTPERTELRRHKPIGFGDDNVLHLYEMFRRIADESKLRLFTNMFRRHVEPHDRKKQFRGAT